VGFVGGSVEKESVDEDDYQWDGAGVQEKPWKWDAFVGGVWILDIDVVEEEHTVEGLEEELHLCWVSGGGSLTTLRDTYE